MLQRPSFLHFALFILINDESGDHGQVIVAPLSKSMSAGTQPKELKVTMVIDVTPF